MKIVLALLGIILAVVVSVALTGLIVMVAFALLHAAIASVPAIGFKAAVLISIAVDLLLALLRRGSK